MSEHQLALYNTLTRNKQAFEPIEPDNVRMYVCGPTVYDYAHIGNARPIIVFDVLYRLLRHLYGEGHVTYVRNITDVDDKINARAGEEYPDLPLNEAIQTVTKLTTKQFHDDIAALGVLPPDVEPTCTGHIAEMIAMIEVLIAKGHAYEAEQHVLLDTTSIANYGQLSGQSLDDMIAGSRVEVAPYKKNPADSVLWKPSSDNQPGWDSPWGRGRPGWHIECSAMAKKHLGEVFDIHGGGVDLVFPHHENELAQSCSAHDTAVMANVWMHNGFLQVEGEKMSKSLGNFITINDQLDQCGGSVLRLNMLKTHYRQPIDWTQASLKESGREHERWIELADTAPSEDSAGMDAVVAGLCDDLNTHQAITQLRSFYRDKNGAALRAGMAFLGLSLDKADLQGRQHKTLYSKTGEFIQSDDVESLIAARNAARTSKDFQEADRLRDELTAMGIILMDGKDPETGEIVTRWEVR